MRVRPTFSRDLAAALLACCVGCCLAQPALPTCALADRVCVDENYSSVCFEKGATPESCSTWLRPFELSPDVGVRLSVAGIYLLAEHHWPPTDPELRFGDRAAALFHGILEQDSANVDALSGLASLAPTHDGRVALRRRVVALDPSPQHLQALSFELKQEEGHLAESAALLERAYEAQMQRDGGPYAWRFARDAVFEYEEAGLSHRAARVRHKLERDLDLDAKVRETKHAEALNSARLNGFLEEVCSELIVRLLGATHCLAAIEHVVHAADRAGEDAVKARLAKGVSDAMFLAAQTGGDVLDLADPAWRDRFESTLQRYFGADSAERMRYTATEITVE